MPPEFMQPSRWGYFITIIGAGITPGSAWRLHLTAELAFTLKRSNASRRDAPFRPPQAHARASPKNMVWASIPPRFAHPESKVLAHGTSTIMTVGNTK